MDPTPDPAKGPLQRVRQLNACMTQGSLWILLAVVVLNIWRPEPALALRNLTLFRIPLSSWKYDFNTLALTLMMFSASAQCELTDFAELRRRRRAGLLGLGLVYAAAPALALLLDATLLSDLPGSVAGQLRVGLLFVSVMPVAMTCTPWIRVARGNVAFTVAAIALTTGLSVATVPVYIDAAPSSWAPAALVIPSSVITKQLLLSVTLPLLLGLFLRRVVPRFIVRFQPVLSTLGSLGLYAALSTNVAATTPHLAGNARVLETAALATVGLNVALLGVALLCVQVLRRFRPGLPHQDAVVLVLGGSMRSTGTAMVVGAAAFPLMPFLILPAAIYSISQQLLASLFTRYLQPGAFLLRTPVGLSAGALQSHLKTQFEGDRAAYSLLLFEPAGTTMGAPASLIHLRNAVRSYDYVSRVGGARIAVVLSREDADQAERVRARLVQQLMQSSGVRFHGTHVRGGPGLNPATVLARANENLTLAVEGHPKERVQEVL